MLIKRYLISCFLVVSIISLVGCSASEVGLIETSIDKEGSVDTLIDSVDSYPYPYSSVEDKIRCTTHYLDDGSTGSNGGSSSYCDWLIASALDLTPEKKSRISLSQTLDFTHASRSTVDGLWSWMKRTKEIGFHDLSGDLEIKRIEFDDYKIATDSGSKEAGCISILGIKDDVSYIIGLNVVRRGEVSVVHQFDSFELGQFSRTVEKQFHNAPCVYYTDFNQGLLKSKLPD